MRRTVIAAGITVVALAVALPATAATPSYNGTVGPGFSIVLAKKPTKAGKATLVLADKSGIHNWHLRGPGGKEVAGTSGGKAVKKVDTGVGPQGTKSFTVTLKAGKYTFVCDPHSSSMKGSFTVR
ncbi:MAG: cupredoxin domain-containing protein [Gaiella sp.]